MVRDKNGNEGLTFSLFIRRTSEFSWRQRQRRSESWKQVCQNFPPPCFLSFSCWLPPLFSGRGPPPWAAALSSCLREAEPFGPWRARTVMPRIGDGIEMMKRKTKKMKKFSGVCEQGHRDDRRNQKVLLPLVVSSFRAVWFLFPLLRSVCLLSLLCPLRDLDLHSSWACGL